MDSVLFLDTLRFLHLIGLAAGLGLSMLADLWAVRSFLKPVEQRDLEILHHLHKGVTVGLVLLWVSGLGILAMRTGFNPNEVTPKLLAKLFVVTLLTLNAWVITFYAMPIFRLIKGTTFIQNEVNIRLELTAVAGVSASCWFSALALGAFTQLKPMTGSELGSVVGAIFLVCTSAALCIGAFAPTVAALYARATGRPQPRAYWERGLEEQAKKPSLVIPGLMSFPLKELVFSRAPRAKKVKQKVRPSQVQS